MKEIPFTIIDYAQYLVNLNLSKNRIEYFPKKGIEKLVNLQSLVMFHNKLTEIPEEIGLLSSLKRLDLSHNSLRSLPNSIGFLKSLEELNLTKNNLTELPKTIGSSPILKVMEVARNPLKDFPRNLINNSQQLLSYLRNSLKGNKVLYNSKLMCLGSESAGEF